MSIAIVTACHSYPQYLPYAIDSVQSQKVPVARHICVLDGVQDEPKYRDLQREYPDVMWVPNTYSPGVSGARNIGASIAYTDRFDWSVPLDEDDLLHPEYTWRMQRAMETDPEVKVWYSDWTKFCGWIGYERTPDYNLEELLQHPYIIATAAIHKDVWFAVKERNGTGYDEQLERRGLRWEDYLFYLEAGMLGFRMGRVGLGLVHVRGRGKGSQIANRTKDKWTEYATEKLERLYEAGPDSETT